MRLRFLLPLLALVLHAPASADIIVSNISLEGVVLDAFSGSTTPAPDWSQYFTVVYDYENPSTPYINTPSALGGSACNASVASGTPSTESGTGAVRGAFGLYNEDSGGEADLLVVNCPALEMDSQDLTVGGWFLFEDDGFSFAWGDVTSNVGFRIQRASATDAVSFGMGNGASVDIHVSGDNTWEINEWKHIVCWYDFFDEEADCWIDGGSDGADVTFGFTGGADRTRAYILDVNGASDKRADENFKIAGNLSLAAAARIGACGVNGADCLCSGSSYADYGKTDESCLGSGNPWACCTGIGTGCIDQDALTDDCDKATP